MHPSAMKNGEAFFDTYSPNFTDVASPKVIDIGAQDVNGSLRRVCPTNFEYVGLDFQDAEGVDIVLDDPYALPLADESIDIAISSSCFEHSEMFWLVFLEVLRVLKPLGLFYLNAPSAGSFHRYPVDCWRFYPDSGNALVSWGRRNNYPVVLLESFTQLGGRWHDHVSVFLKDDNFKNNFPRRIIDTKTDFENGQTSQSNTILHKKKLSQSDRKLDAIAAIGAGKLRVD